MYDVSAESVHYAIPIVPIRQLAKDPEKKRNETRNLGVIKSSHRIFLLIHPVDLRVFFSIRD